MSLDSAPQMLNATKIGAFLGLSIFGLGVHGFRYMQARILGGWNRVQVIHNFFGKYRALVRDGKAPLWPFVLCCVGIPLGTIIAFGSIFLTKPVP